jgi:hypothetical protein
VQLIHLDLGWIIVIAKLVIMSKTMYRLYAVNVFINVITARIIQVIAFSVH